MKIEQLLVWNIAVNGFTYAADVTCQPLAAAVVVDHDLEKIRYFRYFFQVLFRAVDRLNELLCQMCQPTPTAGLVCLRPSYKDLYVARQLSVPPSSHGGHSGDP